MVKGSAKEKARLELEFIEKSKDLDKYIHQNTVTTFVAIFVAILPPILSIYFGALNQANYWLACFVIAAIIIFIIWFSVTKLKPIATEHAKKHKMSRKRYKLLGISPAELDEELKGTTVP